MLKSQPPALQLSLNLKTPDDRPDDDLGVSNEPTTTIPALWGIPLKYISLVTLAVQNSALTIIMHYSRISTPPSLAYSAATAVLMNEILKGLISLMVAFTRVDPLFHPHDSEQAPYHVLGERWNPRSLSSRVRRLSREVFSPDCWKLSIPAILYVIQNNLQYVAASNLDAATFQVTYQMKILTTAAFSVLLLRRKLYPTQWIALLFLAIGVGIVQLQNVTSKAIPKTAASIVADIHTMNGMKGFFAVCLACFTSGLAGVYFEMVLKNTQTNLWVRNVQLSLFSLLPALAPIIFSHAQNGLSASSYQDAPWGWFSVSLRNFGPWAWATVAVQVLGGLVTAMVIKYSDNILKGFATSLSIIISFLASIALFDFTLTLTFILGSSIVLIATWLYNQPKRAYAGFGLVLSTKDVASGTGWHLPLSTARNEKVRGDACLTRSPPISLSSKLHSLTASSFSSDSSLSSTLIDTPESPKPAEAISLDRYDTIYTH
ncbi:hypothetical protein AMATHDRAFT_556 [Amanita thiersii Skay4041]|uniref:Nucleotide-sugar transporter n=1 Tax=Amanita thiersii Skay4041 TaxID=703135 RepID=A0A2A9P189_9AGAR|nr:hypothetical protein AMATHDRAFT_556 [Amanita thiersii Skay4041]